MKGPRNYFMIIHHEIIVAGLGLQVTSLGSAVRRVADCARESGFSSCVLPISKGGSEGKGRLFSASLDMGSLSDICS